MITFLLFLYGLSATVVLGMMIAGPRPEVMTLMDKAKAALGVAVPGWNTIVAVIALATVYANRNAKEDDEL